jgi:hypothetical protein
MEDFKDFVVNFPVRKARRRLRSHRFPEQLHTNTSGQIQVARHVPQVLNCWPKEAKMLVTHVFIEPFGEEIPKHPQIRGIHSRVIEDCKHLET